jgi:hypothetical protein
MLYANTMLFYITDVRIRGLWHMCAGPRTSHVWLPREGCSSKFSFAFASSNFTIRNK